MSPHPPHPALPQARASSAAATEAASSFSSSSSSYHCCCCDRLSPLILLPRQFLLLLPASPAPPARQLKAEPSAAAFLLSCHEEVETGLCWGRFVEGCWNTGGSPEPLGGAPGREKGGLFPRFLCFCMNRLGKVVQRHLCPFAISSLLGSWRESTEATRTPAPAHP